MVQRLDTALSRALLDGKAGVVVDATVLEGVLQQQLLHGGTLDTLMLETGILDEAGVVKALTAAWGTTPVDVKQLEEPAPAAVKLLPERMAVALGTAPFHVDEAGALHVAVRSPLDKGLVDEVSALIKVSVIAHVVPEVRVWQGLHRAYGTPLDERFLALLRGLSPDTTASSTLPTPAAPISDDAIVAWDLVEAMAHLAAQDSRDGIARVATSFARKFLPFAAVFGVRQNACIGWHRQGAAEGALFSAKPFTVPDDCVLKEVLASPSPYLGKPALSEGNAAFFGWLGRRRPRSILLVPVVVARRPVACLFADGGIRPRDPRELGELTAFGARLGPAFEALLRQRQRVNPSLFPQAATTPPGPPPLPADADDGDGAVAPPPLPPVDSTPTVAMPLVGMSAPPVPERSLADLVGEEAPAPPPLDTIELPVTSTLATMAAMPDPMSASTAPPAPPAAAPVVPVNVAESSKRDGTSPFAKQYTKPQTTPPAPAAAASDTLADDDDTTATAPIVLSGFGAALLDEKLVARLQVQQESQKSNLFAVDDSKAPEAWQGALQETIAQGLQGGSVNEQKKALSADDDESGWEDVVYDPSHAKELETPATVSRVERIDLSFPELSTSTLAGLPDEEDEAVAEASAAAEAVVATVSKDPPLATLTHKDLAELLFAGDDELVSRAARELVSRGLAAVPALSERFPGRLRVDPFDPGENVRSADRAGPVVDVLARLGPDGLDAAIPHVDSRYPAHRFCAVLLFSLTPDARAIDLLRARLHDQEPRIRQLAAEALMPFLAHPRFEALLVHLRERTSTQQKPYPLESRRRAIELLGQFRDVGAVPLLIALLNSNDIAEDARRALRAIALQDFGARPKGWDKWWAKAKKRSRLDWLIDALSSDELELRQDAHRELASLAGDDFGYRPDADKRARARAIEVWQQWWTEEKSRAPQKAAVART